MKILSPSNPPVVLELTHEEALLLYYYTSRLTNENTRAVLRGSFKRTDPGPDSEPFEKFLTALYGLFHNYFEEEDE